MELETPYFWTSTINSWNHLLKDDSYKQIIIQSLQWLCNKNLVAIYGFTIMDNHVHFIWEQLKMNGKEYPKNSFEKFTAHKFQEHLRITGSAKLSRFEHRTVDRNYLFWQRDPLAIEILGRTMLIQKLNYIHNNPLQDHWKLVTDPILYKYSSANYYETGFDEFNILTHYMERF